MCNVSTCTKIWGTENGERSFFDLVKCFEGNVNVMNKFFICVGEFELIGIGVN